ncbi:hypothetical protein HanIR_Chr13g0620841 [Helianthus annuus]|nr:hypothetical protein HanIR_Chr13g0620841 [Helianthus annuus]
MQRREKKKSRNPNHWVSAQWSPALKLNRLFAPLETAGDSHRQTALPGR